MPTRSNGAGCWCIRHMVGLKRMCICCQVSSNQAQAHEPLKVVLHNQTDLLQLSASEELQAMQICDIPEREASLSLIRLLLLLSLLLSGLTPACALFLFLDLLQSLHMTWKQKVKLCEATCAMDNACTGTQQPSLHVQLQKSCIYTEHCRLAPLAIMQCKPVSFCMNAEADHIANKPMLKLLGSQK